MKKDKRNKGFTIVELLVVMAILALIVGLVMPSILKHQDEAKKKAAKIQIGLLESALKYYRYDKGSYPTTEDGLEAIASQLEKKKVPKDPWGNRYVYFSPGLGEAEYTIISYGKDKKEGGGDDISSDVPDEEPEGKTP
jgi:general secretion pathway protein G